MHWYLEETEKAAKTLIAFIASQRASLIQLEEEHNRLLHKHEVFSKDFVTADLQEDFDDHQVMGKYQRAGAAGEEAALVKKNLDHLELRLKARASSHGAICGALLQIAKQALSAQFGRQRDAAPVGRTIACEPIRNVIWEGRNQSMHFEVPGQVGSKTRATFQCLESSGLSVFRLDPAPADQRNLAGEVIQLLGWYEYSSYLQDLEDLLPANP